MEIGTASLRDICEKVCEVYRKELAEAEFYCDIDCIFKSLADVMKLWGAIDDNFDLDDELLLTLEKREEQEDGTDHAD